MNDDGPLTQVEATFGESARAARVERAAGRARLAARIAGGVAAVAVALAVGANWYVSAGPGASASAVVAGAPGSAGGRGAVPDVELDKPPIELLPESVIAYETLARHGVPGRTRVAAEALYATLNMELDVQVPVSLYARVEGFATTAEARTRLESLMAPQTVRAEDLMVNGVTPAKSGFTADESAWYVAWVRGAYLVYVKSSFKDLAPFEKRDFLRNVARPVIEAIDVFQRTGRQGIQRSNGAGAPTATVPPAGSGEVTGP